MSKIDDSKPMSYIQVRVTGTPPHGEYHSSSKRVTHEGNITVTPGITSIQFARGDKAWAFAAPWITFEPANGPFTIDPANTNADRVSMTDNDPGGRNMSFTYTLHTTEGNFDPEIINKG